ncbi:hypothetical protein [Streptomyces sp. NPDC048142]|uniref:hypothetical protein n=1 Tax=Streptomyces sp. NPDC048142 TaxID=3365501 RepID=UPI00371DCA1D
MNTNIKLRALLDETHWTSQRLANAVNEAGARRGITLRYDRTSVAHWLTGTMPRPPAAELIAAVLSQCLGRTLEVADAGFHPTAPPPHSDMTDLFTLLAQADKRPTAHPGSLVFRPQGMFEPAGPLVPSQDSRASWRVGRKEVASARQLLELFSKGDLTFGGGHARQALQSYLAWTVAPWLRSPTGPTARRELLVVAAQLSYLGAFTNMDCARPGQARHYYLIALRLAYEANDPVMSAMALRGLSILTLSLGNRTESRKLAQSALEIAGSCVPPHTGASLLSQLAVTYGACGDYRSGRAALARAEHLMHGADDTSPAVGGFHLAALAYQGAQLFRAAKDHPNTLASLDDALSQRPAGEQRARALTLAQIATTRLDGQQFDQAYATWHLFLDAIPPVNSARITAALHQAIAQSRAFHRHPASASLLRRAALALSQRARPTDQ